MAENNDKPTDGIRKVIEAEIINPDYHGGDQSQRASYTYRSTGYGQQGPVYTGFFTSSALAGDGCLALAIPFGIFLFCIVQYGLLAAIGFSVFYLIGAAIGILREAQALVAARRFNPWAWRAGNWLISLFLTIWLSGGFND